MQLRQLILDTDPAMVEEWKWGTPVWSHQGNVVAAGAFKDHVKLNFFKGAALPDPDHLFNAGLDAKATRAIDIYQGDMLNQPALQELRALGKNGERVAETLEIAPTPDSRNL